MSIFSVGVSGLNAAQTGILTTGHNISNASTPGYSRQQIIQGTNVPVLTGSGFIGQGTNVETVRRIYNDFLGKQVLSAETSAAEMDTYTAQIEQIDNLLADSSAGLSPALAEFFKGLQDVAANPSSIPSRQSMLSAAQSLVARFQSLDQRMSEIRDGTNSQIIAQVKQVNTLSAQLASVNQQIINARAGSLSQEPNDLLDQRDQMLRDINKLIRVTTVTQGDGSFNVFFGNGQPLVIGNQAYSLTAAVSPDDPERIIVGIDGVGGTQLSLPESQITGGSLGGLVSFRSQTLDSAQNSLGRIALTLAQNFNDQHQLGMDLTGQLGTNLFTVLQPIRLANALNTGAGQPTVTHDTANIDQLTTSDYSLLWNGTNFQLIKLDDNTTTTITAVPQSVDGMLVDTSTWGSPNPGDSFLIQPTRQAARNISLAISDARLVAAAAPIRTSANLNNTGTGSIDAGLVVDVSSAGANGAFDNFNTTSELTPPILIQFTAPNTYTIYDNTNPAAPTVIEAGIPYTVGADVFPTPTTLDYGYRVKISGVPATGDRFTVAGNHNGVSDNRNAQLLGALQTSKTMVGSASNGPTASYQSAYSQIVGAVGAKASEVKAIGAAQQGLADQTNASLQKVSGVNLDEEAANLLRYQQAYQASAKILDIASKIFDEIIALGR